MSRYQKRSTKSLVLLLLIIAIVIAGIFSAVRAFWFTNESNPIQNPNASKEALLSTDSNHSVSMYVRGPIVGNEQHVAYQMTISPTSRVLTTFIGYQGTVSNGVVLANNKSAYEQFVYALDRANYDGGKEYLGNDNNTEGICAAGKVYYFSINIDAKPIKTVWTTSCANEGSFRGDFYKIKPLFFNQFTPDAISIVNQLKI